MAGDVVGVVVRLEHVLDAARPEARQLQVLVDLEARVDDRRDAGAVVADQVRGAAEVVVDDLAESIARTSSSCPRPRVATCRRVPPTPTARRLDDLPHERAQVAVRAPDRELALGAGPALDHVLDPLELALAAQLLGVRAQPLDAAAAPGRSPCTRELEGRSTSSPSRP